MQKGFAKCLAKIKEVIFNIPFFSFINVSLIRGKSLQISMACDTNTKA